MKTQLLWIAPIFLLSTAWGGNGKTSVQLELHNSDQPESPADSIKSSSTPVASAMPTDTDLLNHLNVQLKAPAERTRLKAVNELGAMGPKAKPTVPSLIPLITDRSTGLETARSIHKINPDAVIPQDILNRLVKRARMPSERDRVRTGWITTCQSQNDALDTLGALGPSAHTVIPDLVKLTYRSCIHEHVVGALAAIGMPDADQMKQIAGGLEDKDPEARQAAVDYLSKSAEPTEQAIRTLGRAMNDSNSGVRLAALQALEQIHPEGEGRIPLLAELMKDPSAEIRQRVLYMIGQLGPGATTAIPLLHEGLKDSDPIISFGSAKLLAAIDPQDDVLITMLLHEMKDKGSPQAMQAAPLLQSLHVHDARVDAALEPYRAQDALSQRLSGTMSDKSPEQVTENSCTLKVDHLRMASGIVGDEAVHTANYFPLSIGRIYCWTEVSVGAVPATVIHRWFRNGRVQHEEYLEVTALHTRIWSSAVARSGDWKVAVLPVGSTDPAATAVFTVGKRK